jgi:hypothetical protein
MFPRMSGENRYMSSQQRVDHILELIDLQLAEYDAWCVHDEPVRVVTTVPTIATDVRDLPLSA